MTIMFDASFFLCDLQRGTTRATVLLPARAAKLGAKVVVREPGFDGEWTVTQVADRAIVRLVQAGDDL